MRTYECVAFAVGTILATTGCGHDPNGPGQVLQQDPGERAAVSFERGNEQVRVLIEGDHFTTFHYGEQWDKPFLHPIRSASGLTLSRGYPVEPMEGEEEDHGWHRGIWYGHGDINGADFWRELGRDKTGMIVPLSEPTLEEGQASGVLEGRFGLRPAGGQMIGSLVQRYRFSRVQDVVRIDSRLRFEADQGMDLRFGDTEDGGFAMRLADPFRQEAGAVLLNSNAQQDTENIWGRAARWVDYSSTVGGVPAGVTILDHPANIRHPTRWHGRGYSLCAANPFGLRDFSGNDDADGSYVLPQGETLTLRYRVVVHEGAAEPEIIERWFAEFSAEPT